MTQRKQVETMNPQQKRALLAIVFAGGLLNLQLPALSGTDGSTESTDAIIQKISNDEHMQPELRAYYLLRLANELLSGTKRTVVDEHFTPILNDKMRVWNPRNSKQWLSVIASWADQVSAEGRYANFGFNAKEKLKSDSQQIANESNILANTAIQWSLTQLEKASDKLAKLNLYFIASRLYQKMGNSSGMGQCNKVLNSAFQACEKNSPVDNEQIKAATSILNSMAYGVIPINVPDYPKNHHMYIHAPTFSEKDFKESEALKLRAGAMADRLPANNHVRRKAHRDLVIWYIQLGKMGLAEREKEKLFKLVGCKDDSILYPQHGGCGRLVWWVVEKQLSTFDCGMG